MNDIWALKTLFGGPWTLRVCFNLPNLQMMRLLRRFFFIINLLHSRTAEGALWGARDVFSCNIFRVYPIELSGLGARNLSLSLPAFSVDLHVSNVKRICVGICWAAVKEFDLNHHKAINPGIW